ncbi:tail fiber protein [Sphingomonas sp. AOB5]|uniref:phage tail protein n=1 Tax=Sphingomonas sp. AOB5 TaxID=3034017 RepID=UPI0023F68E42|nr:tail fiber protein [Sphingomonas sp. AOB5]MDF7777502.1 tail fiber protein [Sphingomonas sp. AOB5]
MDGFIGEIRYFGFGYAPANWIACNGRLLSVQSNRQLYAVIGNTYGGVAGQSFAVPDLGGAAMVGVDCANNPGGLGSRAGDAQYTYGDANVPPHSHDFRIAKGPADAKLSVPDYHGSMLGGFVVTSGALVPAFAAAGSPLAPMEPVIQPNPGQPGNTSYSVMQPYLALNACICAVGTHPV